MRSGEVRRRGAGLFNFTLYHQFVVPVGLLLELQVGRVNALFLYELFVCDLLVMYKVHLEVMDNFALFLVDKEASLVVLLA